MILLVCLPDICDEKLRNKASHLIYTLLQACELRGGNFGDEVIYDAPLARKDSIRAAEPEIVTEEDFVAKQAIYEAEEAERQAKLAEMRFHAALQKAQEAQEEQKKYYIPGVPDDDDDMSWIKKGMVKQMVADIERLKNYKFARKKAALAEEEVNRQLAEFELAREAFRKAQENRQNALVAQKEARERGEAGFTGATDPGADLRRSSRFSISRVDSSRRPTGYMSIEAMEEERRKSSISKLDMAKIQGYLKVKVEEEEETIPEDSELSPQQLEIKRLLQSKLDATVRAAAERARAEENERKREAVRRESLEQIKKEAAARSEEEAKARKSSILAQFDRAKFEEQTKSEQESSTKRVSAPKVTFSPPPPAEPVKTVIAPGKLSISEIERQRLKEIEEREAEARSKAAIGKLNLPNLAGQAQAKTDKNVGLLVIPELIGVEAPKKAAPKVGKLNLASFQFGGADSK